MISYFEQCQTQLGWKEDEAKRILDLIAPNILEPMLVEKYVAESGVNKAAFEKAVSFYMQSIPAYLQSDRAGLKKAPTTGDAATATYSNGYELNSDDGFGFYWYMRLVGGPNYASARKDGMILYDFSIEYYGRNAADYRKPRLRVHGINAQGEVIWRGVRIVGPDIELRHEGHFQGQTHFSIIADRWSDTANICFYLYN